MTETAHDNPSVAAEPGASAPCGDEPLEQRVEALLLASDRPLAEARLGALLGLEVKGATRAVADAIESLNEAYEQGGRSFRVVRVARGLQLMTRPEFGPLLGRLHADRQQAKLSQAALETLAIVAYRQPILRAEIEAIRGVACGEVLRGLLDRRLVRVAGRAEELGRPMLYGTTSRFLKLFGLGGLGDLPEVEGLPPMRKARSAPAPAPAAAAADTPGATEPPETPESAAGDDAASGDD